MTSKRRLAAIMFADIVGYTSMMQTNEQHAISQVKLLETLLESSVHAHSGEVIQYYGDGSLTIFTSATDAVQCAMKMQRAYHLGQGVPLRIGIHIGEILQEKDRVMGDGVNLASRIESIGKTGTILFSHNVYQKIRNNTAFSCASLGSFEFKNVEQPMEVYALANEGFPTIYPEEVTGKLKPAASSKGILSWVKNMFSSTRSDSQTKRSGEILTPPPVIETRGPDKSIAVLPFDNYIADPQQQYLADGIADEIRSQLLSIHDLKVISRASSKFYKEKQMTLKSMGDEMKVGYILEGTVQQAQNKVKVGVQLSNPQTDEIEWTLKPFERDIDDVFVLENEIARKIVEELKIELSDQEKIQLDKIPTLNSAAYEYFKRAREILYHGNGKVEDLDNSVVFFQKAIELDANFSRAYIGLAEAYLEYIFWGRKRPKKLLDLAFENAVRAMELDDSNGECYGTLGAIKFFQYEKNAATFYLNRAIELSPSSIQVYDKLAWIATMNGDKITAIKYFEKAYSLDPLSSKYKGNIGHFYYYFRQFDEGIRVLTEALVTRPDDNWIKWMLGYIQTGKGDFSGAIETFNTRSGSSHTNWMLGYAYAKNGQIEKAEEILQIQLKKRADSFVPAYMIATIYIGLGNEEKALEWLELDVRDGRNQPFFAGLNTDIKFDPIRNRPRFQALLVR
jgi:adenylate cyclase